MKLPSSFVLAGSTDGGAHWAQVDARTGVTGTASQALPRAARS